MAVQWWGFGHDVDIYREVINWELRSPLLFCSSAWTCLSSTLNGISFWVYARLIHCG